MMIYVESLFTPFFEILEVDLALFAALIGQSTSNHKIDVKSDTSKNNMSDLMFPPHANHETQSNRAREAPRGTTHAAQTTRHAAAARRPVRMARPN